MKSILSQLPSVFDVLLDPITLTILGFYIFLMVWEAIFPAKQLPKVKFWKLRGLTSFTLFFLVASYLPMFTDPFLVKYQLFDLSSLGIISGSLIGLLVYELGIYVYHFAMHKYNFLWRTFHQLHHSAERLDTYGALFHSPLDMIGFTLVTSLSLALFIGLPPESITVVVLTLNGLAFFQHANIKTPVWLGYIIQRPESHSVHHGKGIHYYNFSDLPLIDIIFRTFKNPENYQKETGFYEGASSRVLDMLLFRDISKHRK
jgi:sterol desaturase/sphingolipid hydroxylase (fatty acid hydroxylase superfamily)